MNHTLDDSLPNSLLPKRDESADRTDGQRLRKRPLGRYRYVRLRWRVLFGAIDSVGTALFRAARGLRRYLLGPTPPAPDPPDDPRVILLVQLDHLGDAIISTAVLPALRRRYPEASIEVLAGTANREVFEAAPEVDRVHVSRANRFTRGLARFAWIPAMLWWGLRLRSRRVDLGLDVRGDFPVAMILWLAGARRRFGWDCGGGGFLLTDRVDFVFGRPEVESRWAMLAALGIAAPEDSHAGRPRVQPPETIRRQMDQRWAGDPEGATSVCSDPIHSTSVCSDPIHRVKLGKNNARLRETKTRPHECGHYERCANGSGRDPADTTGCTSRVVLHVGSGTPAKQWPVEHWRELLGRILVDYGAQVALVGGRKDRIIARAILGDRSWPGVTDLTGRLTFVELAALLQGADVLVGADSGPAHLAAAVGTPAIVLFSGTNNASQWQPCGDRVTIVRRQVDCSPCHRERCPRDGHPCLQQLPPAQVAGEVQRELSGGAVRQAERLAA